MVTKLQVLVREVYEQEEVNKVWCHIENGDEISDYSYNDKQEDEQKKYTRKEIKTGKIELLTTDNDPIYGQLFHEDDLDIKELILCHAPL